MPSSQPSPVQHRRFESRCAYPRTDGHPGSRRHHDDRLHPRHRARGQHRRATQAPARPARRVPVPRRERPRDLRRQGEVDPQAGRLALRQGAGGWAGNEFSRPRGDGREHGADRVRGRRQRGRGAARRAGLHQAVPAALQHPPARRQVLSVHRDLARRGLPAGLLHARAPPPGPRVLRPVFEREARQEHAGGAREGLHVPLLHRPRAGAAQRQPVPGLLHQALRGALRRVRVEGGVPREHRRRDRLPVRVVIARSSATSSSACAPRRRRRSSSRRRSSATGCAQCTRCWSAGASRTSRSARSTRWRSRSTGARPTRRSSRCATGCSRTASRSTCRTRPSGAWRRWRRSSCSSSTPRTSRSRRC